MQFLTYAVRIKPVFKFFGQLAFVLAVLTLVPLTMAVFFGEYVTAQRYAFAVSALFLLSILLMRIPAKQKIQSNEAMVITALTFLLVPFFMVWPLMSSGLPFIDALFEVISALTTTGLSTTASVVGKPEMFLFSRAWMQWTGGLGIVVLSLAIVIQPGMVAKRLGQNEDFDEDLIVNTRSQAQLFFYVYAILTTAGICMLGVMGMDWFEAVLYSFAAVSTGGFSPDDTSLAAVHKPALAYLVVLISAAGSISFVLYHRLYLKGWRSVSSDTQLKGFLAVCLTTVTLLAASLWWENGFSWRESLHHGVINGLSAQSTAGFSSLDMQQLSDGAKLVLIVSMFIGGSVGSTAGGIKVLRMLILFRILVLLIQRAGAPKNAVMTPTLNGDRLESDEIQNAACLLIIFLAGIVISWIIFVLMGYPPVDSLFEVVSATATVGLSSGISGPDLHSGLKILLCADMLMGRLEIIAWLVLLAPGTWMGKRMEN